MSPLAAAPAHARAIEAIGNLLTKLRVDFMFVGDAARVAWLGGSIDSGAIDVVALMQPPQKMPLAAMAHNNGFEVDRGEIEAAEEYDLVPMKFEGVRVHVLVGSNALYGRMFGERWYEQFGDHEWRVPSPEDLALLLALAEDEVALAQVMALPGFDRTRYEEKLTSIGLGRLVIARNDKS